jgi:hypothetical protein
MRIDEFLRLRQTEMPAVLMNVDRAVGLGPDDVLLAVGSIVEGLGNSRSDLDLLFITPRQMDQSSVTLVVGKCIIDVAILAVEAIDELFTRFEEWSREPWNVTHIAPFTLEERTLLHRLRHGLILHCGEREKVTSRIPPAPDLARLKLHVARQQARTIQVDMAGYREAEDFSSLVFAAQDLLGHAVDALLAGHQITNFTAKWRSRLLKSLPSDWELALGARPTGLTAAQLAWSLHRAPVRPDQKLALKHALRIMTFARAVFLWSETTLVKGARAKPKAWPRFKPQARDVRLPYLDFDIDFVMTNGHVTVARLNEFSETLKISQDDFALALLFDGTTTAREAERYVFGTRRGNARAKVVDDLLLRIREAGFNVLQK